MFFFPRKMINTVFTDVSCTVDVCGGYQLMPLSSKFSLLCLFWDSGVGLVSIYPFLASQQMVLEGHGREKGFSFAGSPMSSWPGGPCRSHFYSLVQKIIFLKTPPSTQVSINFSGISITPRHPLIQHMYKLSFPLLRPS